MSRKPSGEWVAMLEFFYEDDGRLGVAMECKGKRGLTAYFYAETTAEAFDRARDIHEVWAKGVEDAVDAEKVSAYLTVREAP